MAPNAKKARPDEPVSGPSGVNIEPKNRSNTGKLVRLMDMPVEIFTEVRNFLPANDAVRVTTVRLWATFPRWTC